MNTKNLMHALAISLFIVIGGLGIGLPPAHSDRAVTQEEYNQFQEGLRCKLSRGVQLLASAR